MKQVVRIRDWLALASARVTGRLLERVSLERAHSLARAAARIYLALGGRRVHWALQNLRIAFPSWSEADRAKLAFESCANLAFALLDLQRSESWDAPQLLARFAFEGLEHLEAVLETGTGALLLSLHMGCYDLGLRALSLQYSGLRLAAIAAPQRSALLQAWLSDRRNEGIVEVIAPGPAAALRALRIMRSGRPLILLNDLYQRSNRNVAVPLFGRRCLTATGPAMLARRTRAAILPCYVIRDARDHHTLRILPRLELPADAADEAVTAACNTALEGIIRKHPEHWTWAHRRFRHSPDLPHGLYRARA
jgi:KDO2-lipid IV(A) lauroyltransferase